MIMTRPAISEKVCLCEYFLRILYSKSILAKAQFANTHFWAIL